MMEPVIRMSLDDVNDEERISSKSALHGLH